MVHLQQNWRLSAKNFYSSSKLKLLSTQKARQAKDLRVHNRVIYLLRSTSFWSAPCWPDQMGSVMTSDGIPFRLLFMPSRPCDFARMRKE